MKLFAIRIENGETAVVLAQNREEALKAAGLTDDVFREFEGYRPDYPQMVDQGFGPQLYELIELNTFQIRLSLTEDGDYFMSDIDEPTHHVVSTLYPILEKAIEEMDEMFGQQLAAGDRPGRLRLLKDAVSHERKRLMLPRGSKPI